MSYTPNTWATGDTITAAKLNNMENGIANAGSGWDAIIRLTHAENSGGDQAENLTASVVSGTFADVLSKFTQGVYPRILVQYNDPITPFVFTTDIVPLQYLEGDNAFIINPVGIFSSQGIADRVVGSMPDPMYWSAEGLSWA